jgi:hypothetical protein
VTSCNETSDQCDTTTPPNCDDANVCTDDSCDPADGCVHGSIADCCVDATDCDDHDACTTDTCDPDLHVCAYDPVDCDDGVPCTADQCVDPQVGCEHIDQCSGIVVGAQCPSGALPGASFDVGVAITQGDGVDDLSLRVTYPPAAVELQDFDATDCLLAGWPSLSCSDDAGAIDCTASGPALPAASAGCLFALRFQALPDTWRTVASFDVSELGADLVLMTPEGCDLTLGCTLGSDCDDGLFCNGAEWCDDGLCRAGDPACPDDGLFCDGEETCDEPTQVCGHAGDPCSEGETCDEAVDQCVPPADDDNDAGDDDDDDTGTGDPNRTPETDRGACGGCGVDRDADASGPWFAALLALIPAGIMVRRKQRT